MSIDVLTQSLGSIGWTLMYHCQNSSRSERMVPSLYEYAEHLEKRFPSGVRLATLPDIVHARLSSSLDSPVWKMPYFNTMSAEYGGLSRTGIPLIVVAHGVGPMATLFGAVDFIEHTSHRMRCGERSLWKSIMKDCYDGGRWKHNQQTKQWMEYNNERLLYRPQDPQFQKEFWKLCDGEYGTVAIIEMRTLPKWYKEFGGLTYAHVLEDPLVRARLGPRVEEFLAQLQDLNLTAGRSAHTLYKPKTDSRDSYQRYADLWRGPVGYLLNENMMLSESFGTHISVGLWNLGFAARFIIKNGSDPLVEVRTGPADIHVDPDFEKLA